MSKGSWKGAAWGQGCTLQIKHRFSVAALNVIYVIIKTIRKLNTGLLWIINNCDFFSKITGAVMSVEISWLIETLKIWLIAFQANLKRESVRRNQGRTLHPWCTSCFWPGGDPEQIWRGQLIMGASHLQQKYQKTVLQRGQTISKKGHQTPRWKTCTLRQISLAWSDTKNNGKTIGLLSSDNWRGVNLWRSKNELFTLDQTSFNSARDNCPLNRPLFLLTLMLELPLSTLHWIWSYKKIIMINRWIIKKAVISDFLQQ